MLTNYIFDRLKPHIGHDVRCVSYGDSVIDLDDVCIECHDCNCILVSAETFEYEET